MIINFRIISLVRKNTWNGSRYFQKRLFEKYSDPSCTIELILSIIIITNLVKLHFVVKTIVSFQFFITICQKSRRKIDKEATGSRLQVCNPYKSGLVTVSLRCPIRFTRHRTRASKRDVPPCRGIVSEVKPGEGSRLLPTFFLPRMGANRSQIAPLKCTIVRVYRSRDNK